MANPTGFRDWHSARWRFTGGRTLAARLARLDRRLIEPQRQEIAAQAGGQDVYTLIGTRLHSIDADVQTRRAREKFALPPEQEPSEKQMQQGERERVSLALKPFHNPKLRNLVVSIGKTLEQVIDVENVDDLLAAGCSHEVFGDQLGILLEEWNQGWAA